jgi:hypothetical protein
MRNDGSVLILAERKRTRLLCALVGLDGRPVEVDIGPGLPTFNVVGPPDAAIQEAQERVRAAIRNSGCAFPTRPRYLMLQIASWRKGGSGHSPRRPTYWRSGRDHTRGSEATPGGARTGDRVSRTSRDARGTGWQWEHQPNRP